MKRSTAQFLVIQFVILLIAAFLLSFATIVCAADYDEGPLGPYHMTQIDRVIDGDTFNGWAQTFIYQTTYVSVRVRDMDTPELRGSPACEKKLAHEARAFLVDLLANAKSVTIEDLEYDSFGRILASVTVDNKNLVATMIMKGYARPYIKGASGGWCLLS